MGKIVLLFANSISGIYSFRKEVVKGIVDAGNTVTLSGPYDDERCQYFLDIGCEIIDTHFDRRGINPLKDFKLIATYYQQIRKIKPDIVLSYTIKPNIYGGLVCRLLSIPQFANITGLGDALENGGWLQKITIALYKVSLSKARCVFFQNSNNREFFVKNKIAKGKTFLLPGSGVNLDFHAYQQYPEGNTKIMYMGRLLKDKGSDELFAMSKYIKKAYPNVEIQILGASEEGYDDIFAEFEKQGIITNLGTTTDVRPYLAKVHCTVMPSYHEGMSNTNLESAANGRPVITTDVPGCRETVDDGKTGFLVKVRDAQSLIDGVERFLALSYEQKKQMGIEARKKVEREFDRQIVVKAYLDAIAAIK